ncbi:NAD(P)-binding protein [Imleria badia]|nr:NAD(P)-binding protein [Imleria badia]
MGKFTIRAFLREQWTTIPIPNADISDKSIVVTGANVGLGLEAAIHLAKLKPKRLLLTTRDEVKGKQAKQDVEQQSMMKDVRAWTLEMGSFDSVRKFADRFESEGFPINAFIANAALSTLTYARTQDGWETTFVPSMHVVQLVIVSSDAHFLAHQKLKGATNWPSILGKLNDEGYCTPSVMRNRYELSKLLEVMFVRELSSRLPNPTPVSVSAINPGFCHSRLTRSIEDNPVLNAVVRLMKALFARTTEMGSRTLVHPAVEPGERARHGRYVSSCEVTEESDYALSDGGRVFSRRLWTETIEVLAKIDPRVHQIISEHLLAC